MIIKDNQNIGPKDFEVASILKPSRIEFNKIIVLTSRSYLNEKTKNFIESLRGKKNTVEIMKAGSSLKFCLMAEGKADIYMRFGPSMEWDTAAGQAICEAIGIDVISLETGKRLDYNKPDLFNDDFLVRKES